MRTAALLFVLATGCTSQMTSSLMPLMSVGTSMTSQEANLYFQNERMKQQLELERQQQMLRNQNQYGYQTQSGYLP
jgi:hypothetical protein